MANPSHPLWVASVSDPAIALTAPGTPEREAVQAYVKSRTLADLARVKLVEAQQPVLVQIRPLSAKLRAAALSFPSEPQRRLVAAQYAARRVMLAWAFEGTTAVDVTGSAEELAVEGEVLSEKLASQEANAARLEQELAAMHAAHLALRAEMDAARAAMADRQAGR